MKKNENGKKSKKLFVIILFILILSAVVGVGLWQKENVSAVVNFARYSQEEIEEQIASSKNTVEKALSEYEVPVLRDFTLEEEEKIRKGEITAEEAINLILKSSDTQNGTAQQGNSPSEQINEQTVDAVDDGTSSDNNVDKIIGESVTKMYSLKAYYLGKLGGLEKSMRKQYNSLDKSERNASTIKDIVSQNLGQVAAFESECDAKVDEVLVSLETQLKSQNASTEIVETLREAYVSEKSLKKSYYLSLMSN